MIKQLKTKDIPKGMHVILPDKWFSHPFLQNEFITESRIRINKMIKAGIQEMSFNIDKSSQEKKGDHSEKKLQKRNRNSFCLLNCRRSWPIKKSHRKKAMSVRQQSIVMMNRLMDNPSIENIIEAQKSIVDVTDDFAHWLMSKIAEFGSSVSQWFGDVCHAEIDQRRNVVAFPKGFI